MTARLIRQSVLGLGLLAGFSQASPAPNRSAGPPGLLLGLCEGAECRTLWITHEDGVWAARAEGRGLLVPRRSGFWWVGIRKPSGEKDWFRWLLWATPAGRRFRITAAKDETPESIEELHRFGGGRHFELTFVGPDHVAVDESFGTYGPSLSYSQSLAVLSLDGLARPHGDDPLGPTLAIGEVLGPEAAHVFTFAAEGANTSESAEEGEMYDRAFLERAFSSWGIARGRGRWKATGRSGYGSGAARGHYFDYDVPVRIPPRVVGFDEEAMQWERVAETFPDATDAFASPAREVIIVQTPGRLLICPRLAGPAPGPPVAVIAVSQKASIVMVQWAFGASVRRWTREVVPLLGVGPPEPIPPRVP